MAALKLYLRRTTDNSASGPSAEQSTSQPNGTVSSPTFAKRDLDVALGAVQDPETVVHTHPADTTHRDGLMRMFVSDALAAVDIAAGNWRFGLSAAESNGAADTYNNVVVYVWRPGTGAKVGTIIDAHQGTSGPGGEVANEQSVSTIAGAAVTGIQAGDRIVFEWWHHWQHTMATAYTSTIRYDDGEELDDVTQTQVSSWVECPQDDIFGDPGGGGETTNLTAVGGIATAEELGQTDRVLFRALPVALASEEAFAAPALYRLIQNAGGVSTGETHGTPAVRFVTANVGAIAGAEAHGEPGLSRILGPAGVTTGEQLGTPRLIYVHDAGAIGSSEAFGTASLRFLIRPSPLDSAEAFGTPRLVTLVITLAGGIGSAEAFGTTVVRRTLGPGQIAGAEAFGGTNLQRAIQPESVTTGEQVGSPAARFIVAALGLASAEGFGTTQIVRLLGPHGLAGAEDFGTVTLLFGATLVSGAGAIGSVESLGEPRLTRNLGPQALASEEAFGAALVSRRLTTTGITTAEGFGDPKLTRTLTPAAIDPTETFGDATLNRLYAVGEIGSAEAFGTPTVVGGLITDIAARGTVTLSDLPLFGVGLRDSLVRGTVTLRDLAPFGVEVSDRNAYAVQIGERPTAGADISDIPGG